MMTAFLQTLVFVVLVWQVSCQSPNLVFVLVDDVGWSDLNYTSGGVSSIPTPHLDQLAAGGVRLSSHYVQPTCTPSRAALMTGRYAHNTGLPFAMFPGSVAGLPAEIPTMPELLREAGYSAHMVGKWHLGFSQWSQTPVGRGFQSHVGGFMWDLESYTKVGHFISHLLASHQNFQKNLWRNPTTFTGKDWGRYFENGSFHHFEEPRHATVALTAEAVERMMEHKAGEEKEKPLFLYVSYNAAHSPLQPEPEWETDCENIPHLWRRQFCGMVVGLDRNINRLVKSARTILGENTVVVFSSDNGGSVWFGGLNAPLRAGKFSTFEGGVKVPAFMLDFSSRYSSPGREMDHMVHISDWLPTFLSWAGRSDLASTLSLDGLDQSEALVSPHRLVRKEMVLEMVEAENSHHGTPSLAYRKGNYKIIQANINDPHWYSEPEADAVASTDRSLVPRLLEIIVRLAERVFGNGPTDIIPHGLLLNLVLFNYYSHQSGIRTLLFDLEKDPEEKIDISSTHPKVLKHMVEQLQYVKHGKKVRHHRYWYVNPNWLDTFVTGDCTQSDHSSKSHLDRCVFAHPWLPDSADLFDEESLGLVNDLERAQREFRNSVAFFMFVTVTMMIVIVISLRKLFCNKNGKKEKLQ